MAAGCDPALFWEITPRETAVIFEGVAERERRARENDKARIYATATLTRAAMHAKRFPRFEEAFRQRRVQGPEEMLAAMRAWSESIERARRAKA